MKAILFLLAAAMLSFGIRAAEPAVSGFDSLNNWQRGAARKENPKLKFIQNDGVVTEIRITEPFSA